MLSQNKQFTTYNNILYLVTREKSLNRKKDKQRTTKIYIYKEKSWRSEELLNQESKIGGKRNDRSSIKKKGRKSEEESILNMQSYIRS